MWCDIKSKQDIHGQLLYPSVELCVSYLVESMINNPRINISGPKPVIPELCAAFINLYDADVNLKG
jgi:hypothetical protein